ncbi:MAG: NUDIX hydrolase [Actinobacteria bacterium]|nr:NUDIX hydrolase [Actinomycetota bacterium]
MKHPRVGVGVIIKKDNKVLLGKRKSKHGKKSWAFVGGHLEFGETIPEKMGGGVFEETLISVKNVKFITVTNDIFKDEKKHYVTVFVVCDFDCGEVKNTEPEKLEEWRWFAWDDLPNPLFLPITNLLAQGYNPFQ